MNAIGFRGFHLSHEKSRNKWIVEYLVGGKRKKVRFTSRAEAVAWGRREGRLREKGMPRGFTVEEETRLHQAVTLFGGLDRLCDCAKNYASLPSAGTGRKLTDSLAHWYNEVISREWEHNYWKDMRGCLVRINKQFGDMDVGEVDAAGVYDWLLDIRDETSHSNLNKHKVVLGAFYDWIVMQRDIPCATNPVRQMKRVKKRVQDQPLKIFLTPDEADRFLSTIHKHDPASMPRFVLGLFAGLRPQEICNEDAGVANLPNDCIDLDRRQIRITGEIAKRAGGIRRPRIVEDIPETVWHFLEQHGTTIDAHRARARRRDLWNRSGLQKPFHSVLRHTYATMACPVLGMTRTAETMGHTSTQILNRHYKGVVDRATSDQYFNITPN